MQTTYSIMTSTGRNKEAASLANGTPLVLTEIAFGDGSRIPSGGETSLENEVIRKPITAQGVVDGTPNASFFDVLLDENDGPFVIREGGLFDQDGDMIAVIKYDPVINKPIATSGQNAQAQIRSVVAFSDLENLVLQIQSTQAYVAAERRIDTDDGVDGGGDLSQDRTFKLAVQNLDEITGDQVKDEEGDIDWIPLRDSSAGKHKKLRPSEFAKAIGVQSKINTSLADHLADIAETKAGEIDNKSVHPEGLHATLAEKLGGGGNVRSFEHANDSNAPTALEWATPADGDKALVSNASDNTFAVYERRAGNWIALGAAGGASGKLIAFWQGLGRTGSTYYSSGMTWSSGNYGTSYFTLDQALTGTAMYVTHAVASGTTYGTVATHTTSISVGNLSQDDIFVLIYEF